MVKHNVDLVVIEGMGRTLHTNLYAKMKCECLKLAVVKNRWLALRLGGDMYAVICKYEKPFLKQSLDEDVMNTQNQENFCQMICEDNDNKKKGQESSFIIQQTDAKQEENLENV